MINRLKQKINEFRWSLNHLQHGTIQSELYHELFGVFDTMEDEIMINETEDMSSIEKEALSEECKYLNVSLKKLIRDINHAKALILEDSKDKDLLYGYLTNLEHDLLGLKDKNVELVRDWYD